MPHLVGNGHGDKHAQRPDGTNKSGSLGDRGVSDVTGNASSSSIPGPSVSHVPGNSDPSIMVENRPWFTGVLEQLQERMPTGGTEEDAVEWAAGIALGLCDEAEFRGMSKDEFNFMCMNCAKTFFQAKTLFNPGFLDTLNQRLDAQASKSSSSSVQHDNSDPKQSVKKNLTERQKAAKQGRDDYWAKQEAERKAFISDMCGPAIPESSAFKPACLLIFVALAYIAFAAFVMFKVPIIALVTAVIILSAFLATVLVRAIRGESPIPTFTMKAPYTPDSVLEQAVLNTPGTTRLLWEDIKRSVQDLLGMLCGNLSESSYDIRHVSDGKGGETITVTMNPSTARVLRDTCKDIFA